MLAIYILIALFGSFTWLYYFKLIDVFEPDKWQWLIMSFFIGSASPFLVLLLHNYLALLPLNFSSEISSIAYEAYITAGLVEEFSKCFAFFIAFLLLRKTINESIDYFIHICLCALGFSATENAMYFMNHGATIIDARIALSSFGHIFNSSVFAYGVIYARYKAQHYRALVIVLFFLLSSACHGTFDFLLMYEFPGNLLVFFLFFMVTVSVFSITINNTMNHSEQFTYKKVIYPDLIFSRMLICYFILLFLKGSVLVYEKGFEKGLRLVYGAMLVTLPVVLIIFQRISRFTLIREYWLPVKLELPFTTVAYYTETGVATKIIVRGHGQIEAILGSYYGSHTMLCPVSERNAWFDEIPEVGLNQKLFLDGYSIFYKLKFVEPVADGKDYFVKAKIAGSTVVNNQYPVVALLSSKKDDVDLQALQGFDDFDFLGWCYLKDIEQEEAMQVSG